jgi:Rod binding domain-containing protein
MSQLGSIGSLPPVLPAEVRNGSKETKEAYAAAVGFERMLVKQLTKSLTDTAALGGTSASDDGQSGSPAAYKEMIADGIADAITNAGGIGLAEQLYKQTRPEGSK